MLIFKIRDYLATRLGAVELNSKYTTTLHILSSDRLDNYRAVGYNT